MALGVPAHEIVKQNEDSHLHAYMARNAFTNREAALQSCMASQPERDYFLNANDVQNIQRVVHAKQWRRHPNQQQSVELWVQAHAADVLLHQRQEPLPGTRDHAYVLQQKVEQAVGGGVQSTAQPGAAAAAERSAVQPGAAAAAADNLGAPRENVVMPPLPSPPAPSPAELHEECAARTSQEWWAPLISPEVKMIKCFP